MVTNGDVVFHLYEITSKINLWAGNVNLELDKYLLSPYTVNNS